MAWQGKTGLSEEYKLPASGFPEDARYDFFGISARRLTAAAKRAQAADSRLKLCETPDVRALRNSSRTRRHSCAIQQAPRKRHGGHRHPCRPASGIDARRFHRSSDGEPPVWAQARGIRQGQDFDDRARRAWGHDMGAVDLKIKEGGSVSD